MTTPRKPLKRSHKRKRSAPPKPPGRPPYKPTNKDRRLVEAYVGVGMNHDEICGSMYRPDDHEDGPLHLSVPKLVKHFRRELDTARAKLVARMRIRLIAAADAGDVSALLHVNRIFGWNERLIVSIGTNPDDPAAMTDAEIAQRIAVLRRATAADSRATRKPAEALH